MRCANEDCRKAFTPVREWSRFCGKACRTASWQRENKARHSELVRESFARQKAGEAPPEYEGKCGACGKTFTAKRPHAGYCPDGCRKKAWDRKRKGVKRG